MTLSKRVTWKKYILQERWLHTERAWNRGLTPQTVSQPPSSPHHLLTVVQVTLSCGKKKRRRCIIVVTLKTKKHHMLAAEWQTSNKTTNRRQIFFSLRWHLNQQLRFDGRLHRFNFPSSALFFLPFELFARTLLVRWCGACCCWKMSALREMELKWHFKERSCELAPRGYVWQFLLNQKEQVWGRGRQQDTPSSPNSLWKSPK